MNLQNGFCEGLRLYHRLFEVAPLRLIMAVAVLHALHVLHEVSSDVSLNSTRLDKLGAW